MNWHDEEKYALASETSHIHTSHTQTLIQQVFKLKIETILLISWIRMQLMMKTSQKKFIVQPNIWDGNVEKKQPLKENQRIQQGYSAATNISKFSSS